MIDPWIVVILVCGLLFSDTKSTAWGFFLGGTLAAGLAELGYMVVLTTK